jgi:signal transduction histidine kinase
MKALLSDCANEISGAAVLSEVTIAVESDPAPVSVDADGELLRRAVMNLLQNALKYTPAEGKITLRSERRDGRVLVRVTDSGRGISRENQEGLFNKFYRVEKDSARVQGTGLGLYFCRLVAEAHGGAVGLESAPGKGTTVTIDLPASASGLTGGEAK